MRIAALVLSLFCLGLPALAADSPFIAAAERLDGVWASDDFELRVDSYRAQANVDQSRPFHWQRFLVKEVAGEKITFTVGAELFEATLGADALRLTSTSFRGERVLQRQNNSAGAQ
jgi:hypothetical protein